MTQFQPIFADLIAESDKAVRAVHSYKSWVTSVKAMISVCSCFLRISLG